MKNLSFPLVLLLGLTLSACATGPKNKSNDTVGQRHVQMGTLWVQRSAEWKALAYQAFNIARLRLDIDLKWNKSSKKRAIVVDIDETILDNSPYQAMAIQTGKGYPYGWKEWIDLADAKPLPGAANFLRYVHSKGVEILYISNRKQRGFDATIKNLRKYKLPVRPENVMLRTKTSSKEARRTQAFKKYRPVLFLGDNLGDFTDHFHKGALAKRDEHVMKMKKAWGKQFIVFPNPMYGDWEGAVYKFNYRQSAEEKDALRMKSLIPFKL